MDQLQAEVTAGQLTQAQANALEQRLKSGGPPLLPLTPGLAVPRLFRGGPPGGFGARPFGFGFPGFGLAGATSYLGLTSAQLIQQLQSGKSLAQIATSKGKTAAGLEQAMMAPIKKALDAAVARKAITSAKENQILNRLSADVSQRINQKGLATPKLVRPLFRGGPGRYGGWPGPYGPAFKPPAGATPGAPSAPAKPGAPKTPATPGAVPQQLFQPAPTA
jgi:hypothetical protein